MSLSKEDYQAYVERLAGRTLKLKLSRSPTTMGPGYIAEKIAEILEVKSLVNEMAEKVELALCDEEVKLNNLEEEIQLRTHLEYQNFDPDAVGLRNAAARESYIWTQVEKGYVEDRNNALLPGEPFVTPFQLSEDLRTVKSEIIELKALQRILNYRRDELVKLDSGVRLQQKTMETEVSIYGKGGKPPESAPTNGDYSGSEEGAGEAYGSDGLGDPGPIDGGVVEEENFDIAPPPIVG